MEIDVQGALETKVATGPIRCWFVGEYVCQRQATEVVFDSEPESGEPGWVATCGGHLHGEDTPRVKVTYARGSTRAETGFYSLVSKPEVTANTTYRETGQRRLRRRRRRQ